MLVSSSDETCRVRMSSANRVTGQKATSSSVPGLTTGPVRERRKGRSWTRGTVPAGCGSKWTAGVTSLGIPWLRSAA